MSSDGPPSDSNERMRQSYNAETMRTRPPRVVEPLFIPRREERDVRKAFGIPSRWNPWWHIRVLRAKVWHWRRNGHQWL